MKRFSIPLCVLALAGVAVTTSGAQEVSPRAPGMIDPARVTGGTYQADAAHSLVSWRVNHLGFNDYIGLFGDVSGTLVIDPAKPQEAKVDVTVPITSVLVASSGLREHLLRAGKKGTKPDFFGPDPAPARFVSTAVRLNPGQVTAHVEGNLTLNGVTKPVELYIRFTGAGTGPMNKAETIGFEGRTTISRSEFGIGYGIPMVGDDVELTLTAAFEKPAA
ncbi:YceI family protein [Qipengyuania sp.]|uniref:YceI family protein n=1 Tax=Qipengyuania sp. TaxID=2004515 RepID=UPI0035C86F59